ncbi:DMT family transporter [Pelagibacterium lentulum]|uniref:Membrane protein n=1 Tax=Pelagibacterium lentulum TaxID=2029865 RepID=A0A916R604_9HYPH|nr:DMT family transporter [Pelagibacterium lentulum]GGA36619.1 membrane protein [Pelagibacterium lentulum]
MSETRTASKALTLAILGIAGLCLMDVLAKTLGANFPIAQVVFFRFAGAALWLALFIALTRRAWPQWRFLTRHGLRAVLGCLTAFLFFYAVTNLPLAIATALGMTAPVYMALLGVLWLKEPWSRSLLMAIGMGLAGSLVIIVGGEDAVSATGEATPLAWIAAVLAPFTYASALVLLKRHATDEGAVATTFAQAMLSGLIALPFALPVFVMPGPDDWFAFVGIGALGAICYILLLTALRMIPASLFSLVDYTGLLWAAFFGFVLFAEVPGASLWLGGGLVIAACAIGVNGARPKPPRRGVKLKP